MARGSITIWDYDVQLDIGLPEELTAAFREEVKREFKVEVGCYDFPPDAVVGGKAFYSCINEEQAGHHVNFSIKKSQLPSFRRWLSRFAVNHNLTVSNLNRRILIPA